jgi:hypothetical protein
VSPGSGTTKRSSFGKGFFSSRGYMFIPELKVKGNKMLRAVFL